jgi:hypothetical protein
MAIKRYNGTTGQWEFVGHPGSITPAAIGAVPTSGSSTITGNLTVSSLNSGQLAGFRNVLINGAMDIWQRGTPTTASPTAVGTTHVYTADRWNVYRAGLVTGASWSMQSTPAELPADFRYALRVQRVASNTSTATIVCAQHIETQNAWALRGKTVSFSFYARAGANYSPTSSALTVQLVTGTGTDESVRAGMTNQTTALNSTATLTTSWQRFTYTATLSNVMTSLSALVFSTPVGTAGADDWFEVTGLQLEISPVATPFEFLPTGTDLALCQRYFINIVEPSATTDFNIPLVRESATQGVATIFLPVTMRVRPSLVGSNIGRVVMRDTSFGTSVASVSGITVSTSGPSLSCITLIIGHGSIGGGAVFAEWDVLNTTTNLSFSAEL